MNIPAAAVPSPPLLPSLNAAGRAAPPALDRLGATLGSCPSGLPLTALSSFCYPCSAFEWERFMRWMERYAEEKGLGFSKGVN